MTNEEAIKVLLDEWKCIDRNDGINCDRKCESCDLVMDSFVLKDAYNMAIKALEQQSMPTMVYPQVEGITPVVVEPIPKLPPVNQQEPCEDAISRDDIEECIELMTDINGDIVYAVRMSDIRQLPPVKPQEKTGRWVVQRRVGFGEWKTCIIPIEDGFVTNDCHCSMCGEEMSKGDRGVFCPNCGAKMFEPQESEE